MLCNNLNNNDLVFFFKTKYIPVGCVLSAAVAVSGGVCLGVSVCLGGVYPGGCLLGGVSAQEGVSAWGGLPRGDVCPGWGVCPVGCPPRGGVYLEGVYTSPTVNRITNRCKSITFQQLRLLTVKNQFRRNHILLDETGDTWIRVI